MSIYESFKEFLSTTESYVYVIPDKSKQFILKKSADDLAAMAAQLKVDNEIDVEELEDLLKTIKGVRKSLKKIKESNKANESNYKYGCVMAQIDKDSLKSVLPQLKEEEVYTENEGEDFGIEDEPHVTALYGLHSEELSDSEVEEIVREYDNIDIKLTDISMFENEKYDVLKFGVKSKSLKELNEELTKLPHTNDYPDYNPHVTIAYMKKGEAKKYLKEFNEPIKLESKVVEYSKPGDDSDKNRKVYYKLDESAGNQPSESERNYALKFVKDNFGENAELKDISVNKANKGKEKIYIEVKLDKGGTKKEFIDIPKNLK